MPESREAVTSRQGSAQTYPNLDLMLRTGRYYSHDGADLEIEQALNEIDRLRSIIGGIESLCEDHSGQSARMLARDILESIEGD